jgi:hypothetical protein
MVRENRLEIVNLGTRIEQCKREKAKLERYLQKLKDKWLEREITQGEYEEIVNSPMKGKTVREWFDYYEEYIEKCQIRINELKKDSPTKRIGLSMLGLFFIFIFLLGTLLYLDAGRDIFLAPPTGYVDEIGAVFFESGEHPFVPDNLGRLLSLKATGSIEGDGNVKIYVNDLLILDSDSLETILLSPEELGIEDSNRRTIDNEITDEVIEEGEEIIGPEVEPPTEITIKEFFEHCEETCDLSLLEGFDSESYILRIEIEEGTILYLDSLSYDAPGEEIEEEPKEEVEIEIPEEIDEEFSGPIDLRQYKAITDQRVKWVKIVNLEETSKFVDVPLGSEDISIISDVVSALKDLNDYEESFEDADRKDLLASPALRLTEESFVWEVFDNVDSKIIDLSDASGIVAIEYYTEATTVSVENIGEREWEIKVRGPDEFEYGEVTTVFEIPEIITPSQKDLLRIYWRQKGIGVSPKVHDFDGDGLVDHVEFSSRVGGNEDFDVSIDILNVQSYPQVGGTWTVNFVTSGQADLIVRAIEGTTWSDENEEGDLLFLEILCGEEVQQYEWIDDEVVIKDYQCDDAGYETSKVLTPGKHKLEFEFGGETATANNYAGAIKMEWNVTNIPGENWVTIPLNNEYVSPIVVATYNLPSSSNEPTVVRVNVTNSTSMNLRLQNASGSPTISPTASNVHYIVIEEGNWTLPGGVLIEAHSYDSIVTSENNNWIKDSQRVINFTIPPSTYTNPVVLGQVMSQNDTDWSVFWSTSDSGGGRVNPPTATTLFTGKHVGEDPDITRNTESVGYIIIEQSNGNIGGVTYETRLGTDSISGVGTSPPYTYTFNTPFSSAPKVIVTSQEAMDGAHGSWAVLYGASPITSTTFDLAADEDTIGDPERAHTTEQMGYIAFETPGKYIGAAPGVFPSFRLYRPLNKSIFRPDVFNITLNGTIHYPFDDLIDVEIYGISNNSRGDFSRHGLLFQDRVIKGTNVSYNWTSPVTIPDSNSVLLYHLDNKKRYGENGTHVFDFSPNKKNGTRVADAHSNITGGKFAGGWEFDGTGDYIDVSTTSFIADQNFTISAWYKTTNTGLQFLYGEGWSGAFLDHILIYTNGIGGDIRFRIDGANTVFDMGAPVGSSNGRWHHVAAVKRNATRYELYHDGNLLISNNFNPGVPVLDNVAVGWANIGLGSNYYFSGSIDEVSVWNRSLTDLEIKNLYRLKTGTWNWKINATDPYGNNNESALRTFYINGSRTPKINDIQAIPDFDINESGFEFVFFNVTASDFDGVNNLNHKTLNATFRKGNENRTGQCTLLPDYINWTTANYSCAIPIWYWDSAGTWNVEANISDKDGRKSTPQYIETFNVNEWTCMVLGPDLSNYGSGLIPGVSSDIDALENPTVINNTCNDVIPIGNVQITGTNLQGDIVPAETIDADNFKVAPSDGGLACVGTTVSTSPTVIAGTQLPAGNNSLNTGNGVSGQEELYFCLAQVPIGISSQTYSTTLPGPWTVTVLAAVFARGRKKKRKKKELKEDNLFKAVGLMAEELKDKYELSREDLIKALGLDKKESIPVTIFSKKLGGLEALCKYLKENLGMSYHEIAEQIMRDDRTVWTAYKKASEKKKEKIKAEDTKTLIPLSIFKDKDLTILEAIIIHLREKKIKYSEIGKMLERDPRNVQSIYTRARKKIK